MHISFEKYIFIQKNVRVTNKIINLFQIFIPFFENVLTINYICKKFRWKLNNLILKIL